MIRILDFLNKEKLIDVNLDVSFGYYLEINFYGLIFVVLKKEKDKYIKES